MAPDKLKHIFSFLEKNTKYRAPLKYKLFYDQESLTKEDLNVKGNLFLRGTKITSLPDNLKVGGFLDLRQSSIKTLPDNLEVGGFLNLDDTKITSLPDNLEVGGDLYLDKTKITSLPDNLKVGGDLWTTNTPLPKKYTREEIKKMVPGVKGEVWLH